MQWARDGYIKPGLERLPVELIRLHTPEEILSLEMLCLGMKRLSFVALMLEHGAVDGLKACLEVLGSVKQLRALYGGPTVLFPIHFAILADAASKSERFDAYAEIVRLFLSYEVNPEERDAQKRTALDCCLPSSAAKWKAVLSTQKRPSVQ